MNIELEEKEIEIDSDDDYGPTKSKTGKFIDEFGGIKIITYPEYVEYKEGKKVLRKEIDIPDKK